MQEYIEVVESVSGWRVYHIPTDICPTPEDAEELVNNCDAFDFIVDEQDDSTQIESSELIVKENRKEWK
jgi:hypothetical protein